MPCLFTFVTLNLFQGPWPDLSFNAAFFVSHKDTKKKDWADRPIFPSTERLVARSRGKPLRGRCNIFVPLCEKQLAPHRLDSAGPWMLKRVQYDEGRDASLASCIAAAFV